jgi:hypothetical protein
MQQEIRPFLAACLVLACAVAGGTSCTNVPLASRHPQAACARYVHAKKEFSADIHWCARYVELRGDVMEVHVSWEILRLAGSTDAIFQITDEHNARMYLTDEAGRRYDHSRVSGAALGSRHRPGSVQSGSFFFPLPKAGARTFQFHDDENGVRLELRL